MPPVANALSACSFSFQPGIKSLPPSYTSRTTASIAAPLSTSTLLVFSHCSPYFRPLCFGPIRKRQPSPPPRYTDHPRPAGRRRSCPQSSLPSLTAAGEQPRIIAHRCAAKIGPQSCSPRHAPLVANRLGLTLNVGEEGRVVISLQPHFDEGPEDDLEAYRELERGRRLPRQDPSPVQNVLRENEEDFRLIREHHHPLPAQLTPDRTRSHT